MAADVPLGGRSYVQTRFLATEDSSTLTIALCVSSYKKHTCLPNNLRVLCGLRSNKLLIRGENCGRTRAVKWR